MNVNLNNLMIKYDRNDVTHAHMRIDLVEEKQDVNSGKHTETEKTIKTLLEVIVAAEIRKDNNKNWIKWILAAVVLSLTIYKFGLFDALKLWLGLL